MKHKIISCLIMLIICIFTSCTQMPYEAKKEQEQINSINKNNNKITLKYNTLEEIRNSLDIHIPTDYGSIILPENISISNTDNIKILTLKTENNFFEKKKQIIGLFVNENKIDDKLFKKMNTFPESITYTDIQSGKTISVCYNGFVAMLNGDDWNYYAKIPIENIIQTNNSNDLDKTYKLENGELSINSALSKIQDFLDNKWSKIDNNFNYKIKTIYVRKKENDNYCYEFLIQKCYEDISLQSRVTFEDDYKLGYRSSYLEMILDGENFVFFRNPDSILNITDIQETEDKYISLDCAVNLVQSKLTNYKVFKISDIQLMYMLSFNEELTKQNNDNEVVVTRPMWKFSFDTELDELKNYKGFVTAHGIRKEFYVDVLTGEIIDFYGSEDSYKYY